MHTHGLPGMRAYIPILAGRISRTYIHALRHGCCAHSPRVEDLGRHCICMLATFVTCAESWQTLTGVDCILKVGRIAAHSFADCCLGVGKAENFCPFLRLELSQCDLLCSKNAHNTLSGTIRATKYYKVPNLVTHIHKRVLQHCCTIFKARRNNLCIYRRVCIQWDVHRCKLTHLCLFHVLSFALTMIPILTLLQHIFFHTVRS